MVDLSVHGRNTPYLLDFIEIEFRKYLFKPLEVRNLYFNQGLSAAQIAEKFDVSKAVVIGWIKRLETPRLRKGRSTNPENYRHHNPPYGFKVRGKKLVTNRAEIEICRPVVELISRQSLGIRETGRELARRGFKNRKGNAN